MVASKVLFFESICIYTFHNRNMNWYDGKKWHMK